MYWSTIEQSEEILSIDRLQKKNDSWQEKNLYTHQQLGRNEESWLEENLCYASF